MRIKPLAIAFAVAVAFADECFADTVTARLVWRRDPGAESCIDSAELVRAVNRRWQRNVFTDVPGADIVVSGAMSRTPQGAWVAAIELRRGDGTSLGSRTLVTTATDCSSLDDSIALATGLMLDVSSRQITDERSQNAHGNASADSSTAPSLSIPNETLAPRAPWKAEVSLGAEGSAGLLPVLSVGARGGVAVDPPRFFRVDMAAELWTSEGERNAAGKGGHFSSWTAELAVCPLTWSRERFRLFGCVAQRFGEIRAIAFGFAENAAASEPLWTLGPRGVATFRVASPLSLRVGLGGDVPLVR
jgi:hypothetical protein